MQFVLDKQDEWSRFGLKVATVSLVAASVLSLLHGFMEGPLQELVARHGLALMWFTWCSDFRYLFEQLIYAGAIVFIGGKFIETRSIFSVGFDKLDAAKVSMKGPDDNNIVWIGHRYGTRLEAETVADAIASRMKESGG